MKIGIVTTWFERGAAYVSRQYKDVLAEEHDVCIYARGGEEYAKSNPEWDFPYVTWGKNDYQWASSVNIPDFKKWLIHENIEVVIFNEQRWWPAVQLCNEMNIINGAYIDYYTEKMLPYFGLHDFLVCNTKRHLSAFDWHPQAFYIPWGTDTELFKPQNKELESEELIFYHSAGVSPDRKGTDLLLRAFCKISDLPSKLVIHSQVNLKDQMPDLKDDIDELVRNDKLEIIEKTVTAPGLYHLGDVYVYPSRLDGIGLSLPEAISCGLVPVTVDYPPMNEFVTEEIGYVVPAEKIYSRYDGYYWPKNEINVNLLAETLATLIDNKDKIIGMRDKAREYALEELDWNKNAKELLTIIKDVKQVSGFCKEKANKLAGVYSLKGLKGFIRKHPFLFKVLKNR